MIPCQLIRKSGASGPQSDADDSFIGGRPRLPASERIPSCGVCGAEQTFFFQVAFPGGPPWGGQTLAVFACMSCSDDEHLIPEMLQGPLRGADIPNGFLSSYQRNFRFLVFPSGAGSPRPDFVEKVRFKRLELAPSADPDAAGHKIGGRPLWLLEDEAPATYAGSAPMEFLGQVAPGVVFETVEGAPHQIELALDGKLKPKKRPGYKLFLANALYFFGTARGEPLVYAVTQVN